MPARLATADHYCNSMKCQLCERGYKIVCIVAGMLVGNVLLAAAFASYAGPFDMASRLRLVHDVWLPDLQHRAIPMTAAIRPLDVLTSNSVKVVS